MLFFSFCSPNFMVQNNDEIKEEQNYIRSVISEKNIHLKINRIRMCVVISVPVNGCVSCV